MHQTEVCFR